MELEYEIQRKITSAALRLSNDGSPSKAVKRQRKMIYQQSLQQLKVNSTSIKKKGKKNELTFNIMNWLHRTLKPNCVRCDWPKCTTAHKLNPKCRQSAVPGAKWRRNPDQTVATRIWTTRPVSTRQSCQKAVPTCTSTKELISRQPSSSSCNILSITCSSSSTTNSSSIINPLPPHPLWGGIDLCHPLPPTRPFLLS